MVELTREARRGYVWGALCALIALTGCVSSNVKVERALASMRAGDDPPAIEWAERCKHSVYSKDLGYLESGRVRMLSGDFLGSSTNFSAIIDKMIESGESGPVLKLGDAGANILAGTLTDDRTRTYRPPAYEFIGSLQYQLLNHLFLGTPEAAAVEARRAVFAQDEIAETYGSDLRNAQEKAASGKSAGAYSSVNTRMESMAPVLELSRNSYENGVVWYLCGVIFEQDGDNANAALSFRKAWELMPGNPYIERDFLRLIRTQDREMFTNLMLRNSVDPQTLERGASEIILLIEESFVSRRHSVKIPLPIPGVNTVTSVDFPMYNDPIYTPSATQVLINGQECGLSAMALSMQSLAYRDLEEKMPGVVIRNVTRVGTRVAAQAVANHAGNDWVKLGVLFFNLTSAALNKADTRAWQTLPMAVQLYRGGVTPGKHTLELRSNTSGFTTRFPFEVAEGETRLLWVADIGGNARAASASLNGKGAPTAFYVGNSLLSGYPAVVRPDGPRTLGTMFIKEREHE